MTRAVRRFGIAAFSLTLTLALTLAASAFMSPAGAQRDDPEIDRVLIVSLPGLTWEAVEEARPPTLLQLIERSAVASASIRTIGARTSLGEAYVTIGAGNRASAEEQFAGLAFDRDGTFEGGDVPDVFERRSGVTAEGSVFHLGLARVISLNDRYLYGAEPGSFGQALGEAGLTAAVIGNADGAVTGEAISLHREAVLAVMDEHGRVAGGTVEKGLLTEDPRFPFGHRLDLERVGEAFDEAWAEHDVVLLEASDLARVERYRPFATERAQQQGRALAIEHADRLLEHALSSVDLARHLVIVVAPTSPIRRAELTVAAIAGPGFDAGLARSATTRRDGYVTLPDIAPTVLDALGLDAPSDMSGGLITSAGGRSPGQAVIADLVEDNDLAVFRDRVMVPVSIMFIVLQALTYALAAVVFAAGTRALCPWVRAAALVTLAVPPLTYLSGLVRYDRLDPAGYITVLVVSVFVLAALAAALERLVESRAKRATPLVGPLALVALTFAILVVDLLTGAELQINTVFGYSPIVAGRFAGLGNQAFALLAVSGIIVATGAWAVWRLAAERRPGGRAIVAVIIFFAVVVIVDGHPSLGSDVGGVLALVPASVIAVLVLAGRRVTWQRVLLVTGAALATVVAFALIDLTRPADARTHLGRFVASSMDDSDTILTVLQRKANANVSILLSSVWSWVIPIALVFLAFLTWRRAGFLRPLLERVPAIRACLIGALVAGTIGFALNDSGVAVPTMMLAVLLPFLAILAVRIDDFETYP